MVKVKTYASVAPEERPYPLPEGWEWVRLGSITKVVGGGTPSTSVAEYYEDGDIPWISPADLSNYQSMYISHGKKNITQLGLDKSSARIMPKNTVLLSSRAPIGYVVIAQNDLCTNQGFKSFLPSPIYKPEYLYFYLKYIKETLESYASGTTFLELSGSKAAQVGFPLPPLPEQHRIVARIESLFAKLDRAKELAQTALDSFELRKAAILHKAFTGKLTGKWRKENSIGLESWETTLLSKIILNGPQNGLYKPKTAYGDGIRIIRIDGFYDGYIEAWESIKRLELEPSEFQIYELCLNDVLINRVNSMPYLGKSALVRDLPEPCVFESNIMRLSLKECVMPEYIIRYLNSAQGLFELRKNAKQAVNQASINQQDVKNVNIPLPTLPEQREIVRILDSLFEKEQCARELCDIICKIELMKKAILARAFRGELETNDARFQEWKSQIGIAARGDVDEQTLKNIYEAMDADDR